MVRMVDPLAGDHIPCAWIECDRDGDTQHEATVTEPYGVDPLLVFRRAPNMDQRWKRVHYLFCSERHKAYWVNSHRSLYNLPAGSKKLLT